MAALQTDELAVLQGEQAQDMLPKLRSLQEFGVGGILDYAAEAKDCIVFHSKPGKLLFRLIFS